MASPTKAELWNQIAHLTRIIDEYWKFLQSNTRNFLSDSDALTQALEGDHAFDTTAAMQALRTSHGQMILNHQTLLEPIIDDLARTGYNSVEDETDAQLDDIYDGMQFFAETILNRAWTFGANTTGIGTAGGSNVGTGICYRCTKDHKNKDIESGDPTGGDIKLECSRDMHHGLTQGREEFAIFGLGKKHLDPIDLGTATDKKGVLYSIRSADGLLTNGSFEDASGDAATNFTTTEDLPGWTFTTSQANFQYIITEYFRKEPGNTTGNALKISANDSIYQYLANESVALDPTAPTFLIVRFNRQTGTCDGNIKIYLGSETKEVALSAQTGWNDIAIGIANDDGGWYDNFKENSGDGVQVKIELNSRTSGYLLVDECILAQPTLFDGRWYMVTAGPLDFLREDTFSYADSVANTGVIQYWISRLFGKYFPHTSGTPTYSDTPT